MGQRGVAFTFGLGVGLGVGLGFDSAIGENGSCSGQIFGRIHPGQGYVVGDMHGDAVAVPQSPQLL
jgi:hypothetical protein